MLIQFVTKHEIDGTIAYRTVKTVDAEMISLDELRGEAAKITSSR